MTTDRVALLDVNVLLALTWDQHVHHHVARKEFRAVSAAWATCPVTESGLVRLLLTPAVVGRKVSGAEALGAVRAMRALSGWRWLSDDVSLTNPSIDMRVLIGRRQVTDLHLVALAARHGAVLCTLDASIDQFLAPADRSHVRTWAA